MTAELESIICVPIRHAGSDQGTYPAVYLRAPRPYVAGLDVGDHRAVLVCGAVQSSLEALNTARATPRDPQIFPLVPIASWRGWQTLALDR